MSRLCRAHTISLNSSCLLLVLKKDDLFLGRDSWNLFSHCDWLWNRLHNSINTVMTYINAFYFETKKKWKNLFLFIGLRKLKLFTLTGLALWKLSNSLKINPVFYTLCYERKKLVSPAWLINLIDRQLSACLKVVNIHYCVFLIKIPQWYYEFPSVRVLAKETRLKAKGKTFVWSFFVSKY